MKPQSIESGSSDPSRGRMRSPRFVKWMSLLAVLSLVLAACGSDDDAASAGGDTDTGGDTDAGGDEIDLLIWSSRDYYRPPDLWQGFMDENPNINVTVQVESNDDILQQLQRMQDAGQRMPDVIQDDTFLIEAYQNAGLLLDHTDLKDRWEDEDPDTYNEILPIAWERTGSVDVRRHLRRFADRQLRRDLLQHRGL